MTYKIFYTLIVLLVFFPSAAQEATPMVEQGEWGILVDNNEGLYWISENGRQNNLTVSNQTLFNMFSFFGSSNLSPDGKMIVLTAVKANEPGGTYIVDVTTGKSTLLMEITDRALHSQVWSPDGKWLAYCSDSATVLTDRSVRVMNMETRQEMIVIPQHFTFEWKGMTASPYFSCVNWLDNNTLIFAVTLYPPLTDYLVVFPFSALFTVEIDGSNFQQITPDNIDVGFPSFFLPSDFFLETTDGIVVYFMCDATRDVQRANKICRINLGSSEIDQVIDLGEFGITANYATVTVPKDQVQDADLMTEFMEENGIEMGTIIGQIVSGYAVAPDGKLAVTIFTTATAQEDVYLFDPELHSLNYLAQGRRARWFYYQRDL